MIGRIFNLYHKSFSGLSRQSWILSTVILLNRIGFMAVPFMGLYVTQSLGRSESDAGLIISLFGFGAIGGAAIGGKLTDKIGFRTVQILAAFLSGCFFLVFAHVNDFFWLCVLSVVISIFSEAFRPANYAAIASYALKGTETRSYSLNRLATNIGWALGVSIAGLIAAINYKFLFYVEGTVSIVVAILILIFLPAKHTVLQDKKMLKEIQLRKPWQDIQFVYFLVLSLIFACCFFLMFRVVPVFFKKIWHLDEAVIGLVLGLNGVVIALFEMIMVSKIENKRSPNFYIIIGVLIVALSFAVLMIPKIVTLVLAIICILLFTFGEMFSLPFFNTFVIKRSNEQNIGLYAAGYTLSWSVAQVVGPTIGFYIVEKWSYNLLWFLVTPLLLICAYYFSKLKFDND